MGSPLPGVVSAVTVYRRGAAVRRAFDLPAGLTEVSLGPLPRALEDGAVRVVECGASTVRELRVALAVFDPDDALPSSDSESLEAARLAVAHAEARVETLRANLEALSKLTSGPRRHPKDQLPPASPHAARLELAAFRTERELAWRGALLDAEDVLASAIERRTAEERRESDATNARRNRVDELRKRVDLVFASATTEPTRLVLEYGVPGATWSASYVLRFDDALQHARLERRAYVAQRSAEDWRDVALTLSTAEPTQFTTLPELPSFRIGRRQPPPARRGWREPPTGADALFADYDAGYAKIAGLGKPKSVKKKEKKRPEPSPKRSRMDADLAAGPMAMADEAEESFVAAAAPPPPPPAMPAPQSMPFGPPASLGAAGAAPPRGAMMPARMMSKRAAPPEPPAPEPEPEPVGVAIDVDLLAYARLRLAFVEEPRRGKLVVLDAAESYADALGDTEADVAALLEGAKKVAMHLKPPPPGTSHAVAVEGFDHAFVAEARVDLPADGAWHLVRLEEEALDAETRLVVVPRESEDAFRFVRLRPRVAPLLRGPADVFVGERYLLTRELPPTSPGGELRLGLGVDPNVRVARNVRFEEHAAGLISRSTELVHDVEVELRSSATTPVTVEVRERVPTTREGEDDIEVREDDVKPAWQPWEPDASDTPQGRFDGGRRWVVPLQPGETRTLRARWTVRIAAKNELVGGNRREP
ncbi:MAG: DUF4139 domain-containing protein [Sandaracinus sp.]|nr:DUF4139 domain-containing protein [Sandaracinus sp.]